MQIKKLLILCLLLFIPTTAFAHVSFKRMQKEDKFQFEIEAGKSLTHEILLRNIKDEPIDVKVYATDGAVSSDGGFTVLPKNEDQINVGAWTSFLTEEIIHLEGDEEKVVQFQMTIPENITPGVYGGGLSAEPTIVREAVTSGAGAIVSTRVVQPIYIDVPGQKITKYNWNSFNHKVDRDHNFALNFNNEGNTIIKIKGNVEIKDIFGNVQEASMHDVTLLQGKDANAKVIWNEKPFWGIYTAKANMKFHELDIQQNDFIEIESQSKETTFMVIPWTTIVIALLLLAVLVFALVMKKRAGKAYLKKCVSYTVQDGETIKTIASANNISWDKLAKINKLEAPYELNAGQKILVPPKK